MKKLNLGCGFDRRDDYVNADNFEECKPDILMNIKETPWRFEDDEFDHILLKHVLEHVGQDYDEFKLIMQELYRITKNEGTIEIHVPHFRHDTFWSDPTHVRAFTPLTFNMMSKAQNDEWIKRKANYSMIAYDMNVDFEIVNGVQVYDNYWLHKEATGEITRDDLRRFAGAQWNVIKELQITLKAIKPFNH
ncbi:Methyltransferase domain protein [Prochlorococcus marinus str. MIT 1323]|nr:Methyltransferase domain protein [Prochlorococcus marinus str. MIT 1323]